MTINRKESGADSRTVRALVEQVSQIQEDINELGNEINGLDQSKVSKVDLAAEVETTSITAGEAQIGSTNINSERLSSPDVRATELHSVTADFEQIHANIGYVEDLRSDNATLDIASVRNLSVSSGNFQDLETQSFETQNVNTTNVNASGIVNANVLTGRGALNTFEIPAGKTVQINMTEGASWGADFLKVINTKNGSSQIVCAEYHSDGEFKVIDDRYLAFYSNGVPQSFEVSSFRNDIDRYMVNLSDLPNETSETIIDGVSFWAPVNFDIDRTSSRIQKLSSQAIYTDTLHPLSPSPRLDNNDFYTIQLPQFTGTMLLTWKENGTVKWTATVVGNGNDYGITWSNTANNTAYISHLFQYGHELYVRHNCNGELYYSYNAEKELGPVNIYYNMVGWGESDSLENLCDEEHQKEVTENSGTVWFGYFSIPMLDVVGVDYEDFQAEKITTPDLTVERKVSLPTNDFTIPSNKCAIINTWATVSSPGGGSIYNVYYNGYLKGSVDGLKLLVVPPRASEITKQPNVIYNETSLKVGYLVYGTVSGSVVTPYIVNDTSHDVTINLDFDSMLFKTINHATYYDIPAGLNYVTSSVTAADIGLGNVVNTGDSAVPVSGGTTKFTTGGAYTELAKKIDKTEKGASNGVATLDATGRVPYSQLPESAMEYKGAWDASTNTPSLADGTGTNGDFYVVSVAGTVNFGTRSVAFYVNDRVIYDGTNDEWERLPASDVRSVNGQSGDVTLTAADVGALPSSTVIPAAQVNSDWNANSGVAQILNKPTTIENANKVFFDQAVPTASYPIALASGPGQSVTSGYSSMVHSHDSVKVNMADGKISAPGFVGNLTGTADNATYAANLGTASDNISKSLLMSIINSKADTSYVDSQINAAITQVLNTGF